MQDVAKSITKSENSARCMIDADEGSDVMSWCGNK
jgi:hypothetical protein